MTAYLTNCYNACKQAVAGATILFRLKFQIGSAHDRLRTYPKNLVLTDFVERKNQIAPDFVAAYFAYVSEI